MTISRSNKASYIGLVLLLVLGVNPAYAVGPAAKGGVVELIQLLSLRLRLKRLSAQERQEVVERLEHGDSPARLYREQMDRWLTRDFYRKLMTGFIQVPPAPNFFVGTLSRMREKSAGQQGWVYYLSHTLSANHPEGAPPCGASERAEVTPWWARGQRISICQTSYRPERTFDDVGYCGGQAEPSVPTPPREGCGCGPLLLGCLPPEDEVPRLGQRFVDAMVSEISETGAEIAASGRSYDELMTTSTTWQSGLTRFLYLRRELLGLLASRPYSREFEAQLLDRLAAVDLDAAGRWVEREGVYRGSGLFISTPVMGTYVSTYRASMLLLLSHFLCVDFPVNNNVDSESLLAVTHGQHAGVRFEVYESPMRGQAACSGCHAPMDHGAAFLAGLRPPIFGSIPTGVKVEGRLHLNGAEDYRGSGTGIGALASLVTRQPEFPQCAVLRMFTYFVGRPPRKTAEEQQLLSELTQTFEKSGRRLDELARAILLSKAQTEPIELDP
jgi:hypothetical protein